MKEEYRYYQTNKILRISSPPDSHAEMLKGKDVSDMKTYKTV